MKRAKKILLSAGLALIPLSNALAEGWAAPANKPTGAPENFELIIGNVTNWILGFVGLIAVLAIIWGGVQYLTAAGNEDQMRGAKSTIKTAIMGLVIAGIAYALVNVLITTVISDGGGAAGIDANNYETGTM